MKELEFIEIIKKTLSKSSYIGDDCAYLDELGIVITHDTLVEDVHFSLKYSSPYMLGYKSVMVNLSDIFASGAVPKYLTISLSLPKKIDNSFVEEFYKACDELSKKYGFEIVGGDITGADKVFVSICAIGITKNRRISSRKNAKVGDFVVTTGFHGSSAAGLFLIQREGDVLKHKTLINSHLMPIAQQNFSDEIATKLNSDYAMMDTSDGLMDAVFKMATSSSVMISIDFDKIPYDKEIEEVAKLANVDYRDWIFYGGEDFQLVACVNESELKKLNSDYTVIGRVLPANNTHSVEVNINDKILKIADLEKTFNHFKEN